MKKTYLVLVASIVVFILSACGGSGLTEASQLEGHTWVLTAYNDSQPIPGHQPTLQFEDGQVSGTTGCNHYGGTYQFEGDTVRFDGIYSTEMACLEPAGLMDQERIYLELLRVADKFELTDDKLTFFAESATVLVFEIQTDNPISAEPVNDPNDSVSVEIAPTPTSDTVFAPPEGYNPYQDPVTGISVYIPQDWIVTGIIEGEYAILQSYPVDKYVGGEMLAEGDTKCDLNIQLPGTQVDDLVHQWQSDGFTTILIEEEFEFPYGVAGKRFEIDSMGQSTSFLAEINGRIVLLSCFGDFSKTDQIAATLQAIE